MQISVCAPRPEHKGMTKCLAWIFVISMVCMIFCSPSLAQRSRTRQDSEEPIEPYRESALRRFEIVFTISIPFSALHSYLAVRGAQMIRQSKVSPTMSDNSWRSVGGLTFLFSSFIAFWDYMHTRGDKIEDRNAPGSLTDPLTMATPSGAGYMEQIMPREPVVQFLAGQF